MKRFPDNTHLVKKYSKNWCRIYAIGYKYYLRKFLSFISSTGKGSYFTGTVCKSQWCDHHGNVYVKIPPRQQTISSFFDCINYIYTKKYDIQFDLDLENSWAVNDLILCLQVHYLESQLQMHGRSTGIDFTKRINKRKRLQ